MSEATDRGAVDTVRRWHEAMVAGDRALATDLMHDDFLVRAPPNLPYGGEHRGAAALFAMAAREHELFEASLSAPVEYVSAGNPVVLRLASRFKSRATGRAVDVSMVQIYDVVDGKIASLDVYYNDPAAVAASAVQ